MKYLIYITLGLTLTSGFTTESVAQGKNKFGYINTQDILLVMPERASAEKTLQDYAKQLEVQLTTMTTEYQTKLADYQGNPPTDDLIKKTKEEEILNLQQRIENFRLGANEKLQQKEAELITPMADKINKAIEEVSKENGFTYVFDSGSGLLLYKPEGGDISSLVKKKIGIQ